MVNNLHTVFSFTHPQFDCIRSSVSILHFFFFFKRHLSSTRQKNQMLYVSYRHKVNVATSAYIEVGKMMCFHILRAHTHTHTHTQSYFILRG